MSDYIAIEGDEIEIEGIDLDEETEEQIRLIEAGMYDMSEQGIEGWWSSIKKAFKKVTKPFKKIVKPVVSLAKTATSIPGLSSLLPGGGMVKLGVGMFSDMMKVEKATGKKIKFRPKAVKNVASMMYLKGYKEGRADEAKEQIQRKKSKENDDYTMRFKRRFFSRRRPRRGYRGYRGYTGIRRRR